MTKKRVRNSPPANLKAWREAEELSARAAGKRLGVSQMKYLRWERGERFPKGPEALFVMQETKVPLEALLGGA